MNEFTFSNSIKKSETDEWYSPNNVVDLIIPYLKNKNYTCIWCPFDTHQSNFVTQLQSNGFKVVYGHINQGNDFFDEYEPVNYDCIVSNPPFSKRQQIFEKLYALKKPFAMVMNFNGLFDSLKRHEMFKKNKIELLIPKGRMKFYREDLITKNSPNFQSVYVCNNLLDNQIVFDDSKF